MSSSQSVRGNSAATTGFFNSRFPQYVIPTGSFSDNTEKARSIATAVSQATASGISHVYVPAQYAGYNASLISSYLTNAGVVLMYEGDMGDHRSARAYGAGSGGDDAVAIQCAIDSYGGQRGVVRIDGQYPCSGITIRDGITLEGVAASNSTTIAAGLVHSGGTGNVVNVTGDARFWAIKNISISGNTATGDGIYSGTTNSQFELDNVYVTGCRNGVAFQDGVWQGLARRVWTNSNRSYGVYGNASNSVGNAVHFQNVFSKLNGVDGFLLNGHEAVTLENCSADGNTGDGFGLISCKGNLISCTAESNGGDSFDFFDCALTVSQPLSDAPTGYGFRISGNAGSVKQAVVVIGGNTEDTGAANSMTVNASWGGRVVVVEPNFDKVIDDNGKVTGFDQFGLWLPVRTDSNRSTPSSNQKILIFNSDDDLLNIWNGTRWELPDGTAT